MMRTHPISFAAGLVGVGVGASGQASPSQPLPLRGGLQPQDQQRHYPMYLHSLFSPRRRRGRRIIERKLRKPGQRQELTNAENMVEGTTELIELDQPDLFAICNGFQPSDDDFLQDSKCTCVQGGSMFEASCEKNQMCVQSEFDDATHFYGDYSFQASKNFKSTAFLKLLETDDILSELLAGDYATCFQYDQNDMVDNNRNGNYSGLAVCVVDHDLFRDKPSCKIEVNGVECKLCEICDNIRGPPLINFDCTNIAGLEDEKVNECGSHGEGLGDTILQFLDGEICPVFSSATTTMSTSSIRREILVPLLLVCLVAPLLIF